MILKPIPLSPETKAKYPSTLEEYFAERRREDAECDCYEGGEELPWSFWLEDVEHLHPEVVCEILPRAWENGDDVLTITHNKGGTHECYSYLIRSDLTRLLYIIEITENMGIERIRQFEEDIFAEIEWAGLRSLGSEEDPCDLNF